MFDRVSRKNTWILFILPVFILSACAGQAVTQAVPTATEVPAQEPTALPEQPAPTVAEPASTETETAVSFSNDIFPILEANCLKCHGGERTAEGFDVNSYETVMAGSDGGAMVVPGDAEASKLFTLVDTGKMPKKAPKLPDDQIQLIHDWIAAGALDN
ncbi:MAG: c-type cytochrome domain-containing protein [Chloroflexota bacterium]